MRHSLFFIILSLFFTSCAFNSKFHHPIKVPMDIDKLTEFSYEEDRTPTYFQYDKSNSEISLSNSDRKTINENYTIKSSFFSSSSGNLLNGWLLTPKDTKPIATILHFHGSAQNVLSHYKSIEPLLQYGFQVFTFDYSGYGFSEGKSTRKNALKDAYSAFNYIKKIETIKNTRLIIYGQSYGGYLASIVGSNKQEDIEGLVIEGAFSAHKDEAKHMSPFFGNLVKNEIKAENEIQKNFKPVLIIHSVEDKIVPFKFGEKIFKSANTPKEFYEIDKAHIMGLQYYSKEINAKIKSLILNE
ncbi:MAG: alpha/beta fold hydrolase [Polaribacter sp.]|uniref:alpha/beta hydrolase n=1 Tax=Polaribacter sp. TaxID=1920175 RepID=UPI002F351F96